MTADPVIDDGRTAPPRSDAPPAPVVAALLP